MTMPTSDRDLDAAEHRRINEDVATKVMGWTVQLIVDRDNAFEEWRDEKGWRYGPDPPLYSSEIEFAWIVVDHLVAQGA